MKYLITLIIITSFFLIPNMAFSEGNNLTVQVDLTKLDSLTRNRVIEAQQKALANKEEARNFVNTVASFDTDKIESVGKTISSTIKTVCEDLGVTVNSFIKTPVGAGIAALIVYKVAGKDIISKIATFIVCCGFWFFSTIIAFFLYRHGFGKRKVLVLRTYLDDNNKEIKEKTYNYEPIYTFITQDAKTFYGVGLATLYTIVHVICLILIFG